jgi:hypothetical protein
MKVSEFEEKAWEIDGIRIVIRAPGNTKVSAYSYKRAAANTMSITEYLNSRINPGIKSYEVFVVQGSGERLNGRTRLSRVRESYTRT